MARRATLIHEQRAQNRHLLVLDAGDSLVGDQDPARKTQGKTSVEALNQLGYDAVALGPADLGLGIAALQQRMSEANFALLSANAVITGTDQLIARPYLVRQIAGQRLAIIGLSGGPGTAEIGVLDPITAVQETLTEVLAQADIVLLLSHAGPEMDQRIADEIPGLAAIVSGGAPARFMPWRSVKTGALILHADAPAPGHAGRYLGVGALDFDAAGAVVGHAWQQIALGPEIAEDPGLVSWTQQIGR